MLPILFGIGAAAVSALSTGGAIALGTGIGAASVVGAKILAKKREAESLGQEQPSLDAEIFEAAFKEALEKAYKTSKL